ncbi:MAG: hypothetical protein ACK53L_17105, partial [Pirellulaceae bacterium]
INPTLATSFADSEMVVSGFSLGAQCIAGFAWHARMGVTGWLGVFLVAKLCFLPDELAGERND